MEKRYRMRCGGAVGVSRGSGGECVTSPPRSVAAHQPQPQPAGTAPVVWCGGVWCGGALAVPWPRCSRPHSSPSRTNPSPTNAPHLARSKLRVPHAQTPRQTHEPVHRRTHAYTNAAIHTRTHTRTHAHTHTHLVDHQVDVAVLLGFGGLHRLGRRGRAWREVEEDEVGQGGCGGISLDQSGAGAGGNTRSQPGTHRLHRLGTRQVRSSNGWSRHLQRLQKTNGAGRAALPRCDMGTHAAVAIGC